MSSNTDHRTFIESDIIENYLSVRKQSERLIQTLSPEDMIAQSMPDASPIKWHLAHTTWFFETFILSQYVKNYRLFDQYFPHLFNSYYESAGTRHARIHRGLLTRPSFEQVMLYRKYVDDGICALLQAGQEVLNELIILGLHHEMQHQELMLTDVLHLMSHNPMSPAVFPRASISNASSSIEHGLVSFDGGLVNIGAREQKDEFSYDCERPQHRTFLSPYALGNRLITNAEWIAFMEEGAYKDPMLWLSDAWMYVKKHEWNAPLYWREIEGQWHQFGLMGLQPLDLNAPVSHVSYYEADAFARWAGNRLPKEHELEYAAFQQKRIQGNFVEDKSWQARAVNTQSACENQSSEKIHQLYGDVWEWTQSAYSAYPGFKPENGALGEYNGKFMINQLVLKGGSFATPIQQMRSSYRNFFYPFHRWQFTGVRLAEDI